MEASRPPLKRNRNKGNVQITKKYQHLNWPNALTKNENSSDSNENHQSSTSGNLIIKIVLLIENWNRQHAVNLEHFLMNRKDTKSNEDETKDQIQSQVLGQNPGQLISGQETLVLPVDTKVLNSDLSTIMKQNPNAKVYVVVPRQMNN